jgi:uncharacterized protein YodC (DUF2158 family)
MSDETQIPETQNPEPEAPNPQNLIGELVRLKSGGIAMTVIGIDAQKQAVLVAWSTEAGGLQNAVLPAAAIVLVSVGPRVGGAMAGGPMVAGGGQ